MGGNPEGIAGVVSEANDIVDNDDISGGTHGDGGKILILLSMLFMLFIQGGGFHHILN